tara:strand:- start:1266 stop:1535 length:270 start_codon:yes stop_codon:yes gene_type:complete
MSQQIPQNKYPSFPSAGSKIEKLNWYSNYLISEALTKEKSGKTDDAIKDFLKAADILLVMAKSHENYEKWKKYSDKAIKCQEKVKSLIK